MMHGGSAGTAFETGLLLTKDLVCHTRDLWLALGDASTERQSAKRVWGTLRGVKLVVLTPYSLKLAAKGETIWDGDLEMSEKRCFAKSQLEGCFDFECFAQSQGALGSAGPIAVDVLGCGWPFLAHSVCSS